MMNPVRRLLCLGRALQALTIAAAAIACADFATSAPVHAEYSLLDVEPGEYTLTCRVVAQKGWTRASEVRLGFDVQAEDNLAYVRIRGGRVALFRQTPQGREPIGQPRSFRPGKSWEASLQRRDGYVRFIAQGRVLLDQPWDQPIGGRAGTLTAGGVKIADVLLQPYAPPILLDDFTREAGETGSWTVHCGTWRNTLVAAPNADPSRSANPFSVRALATPEALMSTGSWFWDTYTASVAVKPLDADAVAIAVYVQDSANMLQFRWKAGASDAQRARELVLLRNGQPTVLVAGDGGFYPNQWYRLELRAKPGHIEALIDRYPALSATTDAFGQGGVGLWCRGGEAVFDDMLVTAPGGPNLELPRINPVFLADEVMTANELYTPAGQWRPAEAGVHWNWGEYFDDVQVHIPLTAIGPDPLTVLLRAEDRDRAYAVTLRRNEQKLEASLVKCTGDPQSSGSCEAGDDESVTVSAEGDKVAVSCAGDSLIEFTDQEPLSGRKLGLSGAADRAVQEALITSDHYRDYAFDTAPTDWFGGKGLWQVTTRWPCQPGWTFFGGAHDENPVLWTKYVYEGDVVLEFFANIKMDLPPPPGYSHPSDVNAALCADGVELGSGYNFILAGWNNTKSAILRRGEVVAETNEVVFVNPTSSNAAFHRHWFRVRVEKIGNRIGFWVDGRRILEYEDPNPLPDGRAAIWSFHNGIMIGRARLWFEREKPGGVVPAYTVAADPPPPTPRAAEAPVHDDFERGVGEWRTFGSKPTVGLALDDSTHAGGKRSLRITNLMSGGPFGVYAVVTPFRATMFSKLSFDYRIPSGVQVNVYVYVNRKWHAIELCAEGPESGSTPLLGTVEGVQCDDQWHHAEFDLLPPLRALYPELKALTVKYVAFAAPEESYVRCGIGGNHRGTTYWIDNFEIGSAAH